MKEVISRCLIGCEIYQKKFAIKRAHITLRSVKDFVITENESERALTMPTSGEILTNITN
jgi:hypothetical protein